MQDSRPTNLRLVQRSLDTSGPDGRLAELVAHLTGCSASIAVDAVDHALPADAGTLSIDDRMGVVARAMVAVRHDHRSDLRTRRPA
jgi:hypothetical protein